MKMKKVPGHVHGVEGGHKLRAEVNHVQLFFFVPDAYRNKLDRSSRHFFQYLRSRLGAQRQNSSSLPNIRLTGKTCQERSVYCVRAGNPYRREGSVHLTSLYLTSID